MKPTVDIQEVIQKIEKEVKNKEVLCNGKPLHGYITVTLHEGFFQLGEYNVKWK